MLNSPSSSNDVCKASQLIDEKNKRDKQYNTEEGPQQGGVVEYIVERDEGDGSNVYNSDEMRQDIVNSSANCNGKDHLKIIPTKTAPIPTIAQKRDNKIETEDEKPLTDQKSIITTTTLHSSTSLHSLPLQTIKSPDNVIADNNIVQNKKLELRYTKEADIQTNDSLETDFAEEKKEVV
jgi:hypothetical protein